MVTGVGIIGVAPGRSWAAIAHIPALRALPAYEIVALSTTRQESASAAAAEFGVPKAYDNHQALVNDPAVDLVVVTVKVPHHFELVTAALNAGKHVYCEWPLGNGLAEAEEMAALAQAKGVLGVVGTQARVAPEIEYLTQLIEDGFVGDVLSTSLYDADEAAGPTDAAVAYDQAIEVLRAIGNDASLGKALVAYGRYKAETGAISDGKDMLRDALAVLSRLGLEHAAEEARKLLTSLS